MSEIEPTFEDLMNPYVLQLLETICKQDDRIEELELRLHEGGKEYRLVSDACDAYVEEIERLKTALDNERARGIHSCGPHCQKLECRQRREIEQLQARVEELEYLCERYIAWFKTEPRIGGTDELE